MRWLTKGFADDLTAEIKRHYKSIYDKTLRTYGIVDDIVVDGKKYLMKYDRNMGVHYCFTIYDGEEIIAEGDFPAQEVDEEYRVIRFYSSRMEPIFEYKLD